MSLLAAIVRRLIRRLSQDDRDVIGMELAERDDSAQPVTPPGHTGHDGDGPDWTYVWASLIDAASKAGRVEILLSDERAFFDFDEITTAAAALRTMIDSAYSLMCTAPRLDGLGLDRGDDLDTVRRLVDIRRAQIVDTELAAVHRAPVDGAPVWSIDYRRHGGFVATSQPGNGTTPWKFWGAAPTARSAAHLLSWYFLDQPPATVFDPPLPETTWPLATIGPDSDVSVEGPSVRDLLDQRGPIYDQHIAACRSARKLLRGSSDIRGHLAARAAELDATDPQRCNQQALGSIGSPRNHDHDGYAHTVQWVPTSLIVATGHPRWGDFGGHRAQTPYRIIEGLLSNDLDVFTYKLFTDQISLLRAPGWAGPLYRIGGNGNHRIHTARLLNLPWLAAEVEVESIATSWDMLGLIAADRDRGMDRRRPLESRLQERAVLVEGLIRRGVIVGELTDDGHGPALLCHRLPAAWLLRAPRYATTINSVYESRYPGALAQLGIPVAIGTDAVAWTRWLGR